MIQLSATDTHSIHGLHFIWEFMPRKKKKKNLNRMLSFLEEPEGDVSVSRGSDKSTLCGAPPRKKNKKRKKKSHSPTEWVKRQQQYEQYGTVHMPRTGTSAIRSMHNGSAQVAQVVVCHAPCAEPEIEWKAFPQSWQSPGHVCGNGAACSCGSERNRRERERASLFNGKSA